MGEWGLDTYPHGSMVPWLWKKMVTR